MTVTIDTKELEKMLERAATRGAEIALAAKGTEKKLTRAQVIELGISDKMITYYISTERLTNVGTRKAQLFYESEVMTLPGIKKQQAAPTPS